MDTIDRAMLMRLADRRGWPSVSLYLPTHRTGAEKDQDPIRLRNLIKSARDELLLGGSREPETQALLAEASRLLDDATFWRQAGDGLAVFEATHGTAPKYAGKDAINPGSVILSGALMLDYLGWGEAAERIRTGIQRAIQAKIVTYDLARQLKGATQVKCSAFGLAIIENMG